MELELYKDVTGWHGPLGHELELLAFVDKALDNNLDTFVDIGANVGGWLLNIQHKFKNKIVFEPNTKALHALKENVRLNNVENTIISGKALSNKTGTSKLLLFDSCPSHSTLMTKHPTEDTVGAVDGSEVVPITTLDKYLTSITYANNIDFIKIDTEGLEVEVIEGALATIAIHSPKLIIEIHLDGHADRIRELLPDITFTDMVFNTQPYLIAV